MFYKSILVHVDGSNNFKERARLAASIAKLDANVHIIGAAMTGVSRFIFDTAAISMQGGNLGPFLDEQLDILRARANRLLDNFDDTMRSCGVSSFGRRLIDDESLGGLSLQAQYSDLALVGQPDPDEPSTGMNNNLPEYVAMVSGRPVLVVPYAGSFDVIGRNALLAWDASIEATRAVHFALPFLQQAAKVHVAVFNVRPEAEQHGQEPGADIALYLARHDIKVEVVQETTHTDIGNALLSLCADLQSELLVMGCYGHSRFREIMLGGVSRTVLTSMTTPVLLAH